MKPLFFTIFFLMFLIFLANDIHAEEVIIDDFKGPQLASGWKEKSFLGQTAYFLTKEDDIPCLKAISNGTASGMFNKINFDPAKMPFISWSWKVNSTVPSGNAYHKKSDDYAARIYVIFPSFFFWKTRALNYI